MSTERSKRGPREIVRHARDHVVRIRRWTVGLDMEGYLADERTQYACERAFIALGEALKDLSVKVDLEALLPGGPWIDPVRFRNFLAHEYDDRVMPPLVWRTITIDLPELDAALELIESKLRD
ncbi:MAG: HepT-like ribonuclease domain-containing protein [Rhodospirillaceae bacterium]|nr:HepT-like ribonuclease domain-containing protein [Rhodospirillaceae bacterium]